MERDLSKLKSILSHPIQKGTEVWIADTARVFGQVVLGDESSVWFGAVLRGDGDWIRVGHRSNIQENAVVHVDPGFPVQIGTDCIIGHCAIVHGATLGNYCIIGANALVTEGMMIPDYSIVMGSPAKVVKQMSEAHIEKVKRNARSYVELSKEYLKYFTYE